MTASVAGEWVLNPQRPDGSVVDRPTFALLLTLGTLGFVLLCVAIGRLRRESGGRGRWARIGSALSFVGACLLALFAVLVLGAGLALGAPLGASFLAFALGLLLLSVGPVVWGLSLRGRSPAPGVWQVLVLSGVTAFAAVAVPLDPWHDVALITMFLAWSAVGVLVLRNDAASDLRARPARQASSV